MKNINTKTDKMILVGRYKKKKVISTHPSDSYGELLIGIGLIIGAFVGIAAFFGALMNWNYIMAGAASTNGLLLVVAILLVLAWKVAGYYGADFVLLRWLGVPWRGSDGKSDASTPSPTGQFKPSAS